MSEKEFDRFKDNYHEILDQSLAFSGQDTDFFAEMKARHILDAARRLVGPPAGLKILDLGCGVGPTESFLAPHVGSLHGVDVSAGVLETAAKRNPTVDYRVFDGKSIPFPDKTFDVVFAICVLHHVKPEDRAALIQEMRRVTKGGGIDMIFEHNPLNPLTMHIVNNCEFDHDAILLREAETRGLFRTGGLSVLERRYYLFFPWRGRLFDFIERRLSWLPLGGQYFVAART